MSDEEDLAAYLGNPDLARELVACGRERGWTPRVPARGWRAKGYTDAALATLVVDRDGGAEKLIVKATPGVSWEAAAYAAARSQCPAAFRRHLVLGSMPAWEMDGGGVLTFQKLAADDVTSCGSLADLPAADLPATCELIAGRLIRAWNPEPPRPASLPITAVLRDQMGYELGSHGSIRSWAREADLLAEEVPWLMLPDEPAACPNPLLLAHDASPAGTYKASILTGRCHGDLHLLNVLLPRRPGGPLRPDEFLLIDLGGYRRHRPITTDPVFLSLSVLAHGLRGLTPEARQGLLDHLVHPAARGPGGHLAEVVDRVLATVAGSVAAHGRGWSEELRFQLRLSVIGVATLFTSFSNLGSQVRWWFFRLAARLGRELLLDLDVPVPGRAPRAANPFHDLPAPVPGPSQPAAARPVEREVALAWRAALSDPPAARRHLDAAYERLTRGVDRRMAAAVATRAVLSDLVDDATQILGADDPATLRLRHKLAGWSHLAGDAIAALRMYRAVATVRARVLGHDHPDTLESERRAGGPPLLDDAAHQAYGS